jgi:hypothetical protein
MWDGWIILARVSQIREIFPVELDNPDARIELELALRAETHTRSTAYIQHNGDGHCRQAV